MNLVWRDEVGEAGRVNALQFLLICSAGWIDRNQQSVIEYLQEEVRVLKEQLGKRPSFKR